MNQVLVVLHQQLWGEEFKLLVIISVGFVALKEMASTGIKTVVAYHYWGEVMLVNKMPQPCQIIDRSVYTSCQSLN
jgi:hypothetical protein